MRILPGVHIIVCVFCMLVLRTTWAKKSTRISSTLWRNFGSCDARYAHQHEYGKESGHQMINLIWLQRATLLQFPQPFPCDGINKDIEQLCREGAPLCDALPCLKWCAIIYRCSAYHCCICPEVPDQLNHL